MLFQETWVAQSEHAAKERLPGSPSLTLCGGNPLLLRKWNSTSCPTQSHQCLWEPKYPRAQLFLCFLYLAFCCGTRELVTSQGLCWSLLGLSILGCLHREARCSCMHSTFISDWKLKHIIFLFRVTHLWSLALFPAWTSSSSILLL